MTGREAACEVAASITSHRAFVAVYPPLIDKGVTHWRVRRFELPIHLLDQYFAEEDLIHSLFYKLENLEEVESLLADWRVDPERLDAPWKCEYPL